VRALATWAAWLADAQRPDAPDAVLAAASRRDAQTPRIPIEGAGSYGYGLFLDEHPRHGRLVSHSGGYPGYGAHMRWHADTGLGVIVLENARYSGAAVPAAKALELVLDQVAAPEAVPQVWPETLAARETVERLLRRWDDAAAAALLAENVVLDEAIERRRATIDALTARVGLGEKAPVLPIEQAAPSSATPAHLAWTVPGTRGALRVEIRLTPELHPTVQTLAVRLG
jgi:hypothetical protein